MSAANTRTLKENGLDKGPHSANWHCGVALRNGRGGTAAGPDSAKIANS
jgi:hypothetical protein